MIYLDFSTFQLTKGWGIFPRIEARIFLVANSYGNYQFRIAASIYQIYWIGRSMIEKLSINLSTAAVNRVTRYIASNYFPMLISMMEKLIISLCNLPRGTSISPNLSVPPKSSPLKPQFQRILFPIVHRARPLHPAQPLHYSTFESRFDAVEI